MEKIEHYLNSNQKTVIALINISFFMIGMSFLITNYDSENPSLSLEALVFTVIETFKQGKTYLLMLVEFISKFLLFFITTKRNTFRSFSNAIPIYGFCHSTILYIIKKPRVI